MSRTGSATWSNKRGGPPGTRQVSRTPRRRGVAPFLNLLETRPFLARLTTARGLTEDSETIRVEAERDEEIRHGLGRCRDSRRWGRRIRGLRALCDGVGSL